MGWFKGKGYILFVFVFWYLRGCHGGDRMVVGLTTAYAISAYPHWGCEFESRSWWGVLDATLCDKVWRRVNGFPLGTPDFSTNRTDRHDIAEILLKMALKQP
jgi:hypothetical protein